MDIRYVHVSRAREKRSCSSVVVGCQGTPFVEQRLGLPAQRFSDLTQRFSDVKLDFTISVLRLCDCRIAVPLFLVLSFLTFSLNSLSLPVHNKKTTENKITVEVMDSASQQAAGEGVDTSIQIFTDAYEELTGGELTAETMPLLTGEQRSLLAYQIFHDELMEGGLCQLIQNGYGGYIFANPFAKVMCSWGMGDLSKLVYAAKKIYDAHREDLEHERTDDEFTTMYEQYEVFDVSEDEFLEKKEEYTALVTSYVDEHLGLFAKIIE